MCRNIAPSWDSCERRLLSHFDSPAISEGDYIPAAARAVLIAGRRCGAGAKTARRAQTKPPSQIQSELFRYDQPRRIAESVMPLDTPTSTQLSQVNAQVTAPAFLLGAVAAFISVLISRMNRIIDRSQALNAIGDDNPGRAQ